MILLMFIGPHIPSMMIEANFPRRSALDLLTEERPEEDPMAVAKDKAPKLGRKKSKLPA